VGLLSEPIHVVAFGLAILMAWPWDVALSAIETSQDVVPTGSSSFLVPRAQRGHRMKRFGRWVRASGPALSQAYQEGEEEGDDVGPLQAAPGLFLLPSPPGALELAPGAPALAGSLLTPSIARLCRLRC
jgi:hypothetical protein